MAERRETEIAELRGRSRKLRLAAYGLLIPFGIFLVFGLLLTFMYFLAHDIPLKGGVIGILLLIASALCGYGSFKLDRKANKVGRESGIEKKVSRWWYLAPLLLGIIGGIVAYFEFRNVDRRFAKRLLLLGLLVQIIYGIFSWAGVW